jgi:hypothetical protein
MLRFITVSRLALNPNLFFEIGSSDIDRSVNFEKRTSKGMKNVTD